MTGLHYDMFSEPFLQLLLKLMRDEDFAKFYLVGGSALALYLGHRKSIDIDLFTSEEFNEARISEHLEKNYNGYQINIDKGTVTYSIEDIKVEFFLHPYDLLELPIRFDDIRICGLKDICAFKLNAISGRGSKKDFWDLAYLLDKFSIEEQIDFFKLKYPRANLWHILKSLSYFEDAENENIEIQDLNGVSWQDVKAKICEEIKDLGIRD
jgi:hypothetical protein